MSAVGWAMLLDGPAGWVPCSTGASEWSSWSGEAPDCVPLLDRALAGLSSHPYLGGVPSVFPGRAMPLVGLRDLAGWQSGFQYCSWLGEALGWATCLGEASSCVQQLGRALCLALLLDSMGRWYHSLSSEGTQSHCSGSLIMQGKMLYSTVG